MKNKLFIIVLILISFIAIISFYFSSADAENHTYIEITVHPGDTLWSIAQKYNTDNKDIRVLIHQIEVKNNLSSSILNPWQVLKIPV